MVDFDKGEKGEEEGEENEDTFPSLEGFFVCEEYVEQSVDFGPCFGSTKLLCSPMACTDFDLTGQIIWPAAVQLGYWCHANATFLRGKSVLELGAGTGLSGLVAAAYASKVVLTDHNDIVMGLLRKNEDYFMGDGENTSSSSSSSSSSCVLRCAHLEWGDDANLSDVLTETGVPDVIIGADIVMWPNTVKVRVRAFFLFSLNLFFSSRFHRHH
jgi:hypothetical protein